MADRKLAMKLLALTLVACLALPHAVAAQSPIQASIDRAVAQQAATPGRQNRDLYWSGLALITLGGGMLAWAVNMSDLSATCPGNVVGSTSCTDRNNHRALWMAGGVAIAGAGVALAAIGRKRVRALPTVEFKPSGLAITQRVTF